MTKITSNNQFNSNSKTLFSLDDYTPSVEAIKMWNKIVEQQLIKQLERLLGDLYPDGVSIKQLDDLLSLHKDFIEEALGMKNETSNNQVYQKPRAYNEYTKEELIASIDKAIEAYEKGNYYTLEEIEKEFNK